MPPPYIKSLCREGPPEVALHPLIIHIPPAPRGVLEDERMTVPGEHRARLCNPGVVFPEFMISRPTVEIDDLDQRRDLVSRIINEPLLLKMPGLARDQDLRCR